jgi:hypothetical protein
MTRGRRPDSPYKRWVKTLSGSPPRLAAGLPDREILGLMGDPDSPLCWLEKDRWIRVLGEVQAVERRRHRRLSRPAYEKLVRSLAARAAAHSL